VGLAKWLLLWVLGHVHHLWRLKAGEHRLIDHCGVVMGVVELLLEAVVLLLVCVQLSL